MPRSATVLGVSPFHHDRAVIIDRGFQISNGARSGELLTDSNLVRSTPRTPTVLVPSADFGRVQPVVEISYPELAFGSRAVGATVHPHPVFLDAGVAIVSRFVVLHLEIVARLDLEFDFGGHRRCGRGADRRREENDQEQCQESVLAPELAKFSFDLPPGGIAPLPSFDTRWCDLVQPLTSLGQG